MSVKRISFVDDFIEPMDQNRPEKFDYLVLGLSAFDWIYLIVNLAKIQAIEGKGSDAFSTVKTLFDSTIAQNDDRLRLDLQMYMLGLFFALICSVMFVQQKL